ncbi:MAG TPA: hypothetical protein GXZ24_01620 [Firmicutes bacterium]|nr:hypothetical protein [Bacillota bacterium]
MKRDEKQKPVSLKVLRGGGKGQGRVERPGKRPPLFFILLFLALFLPAQILIGWIWGMFGQGAAQIVVVGEGSLERTFSISGLVTFEEEIIFSPRSGFAHYLVEEGSRAPVGAELARVSDFPPVGIDPCADEGGKEESQADYFVKFKDWFFGNEPEEEENGPSPVSTNGGITVVNPLAGLVSLHIDGWERFGPGLGFPYFTEEEFCQGDPQIPPRRNGQEVRRSLPLAKIINNYTWYFSSVLPLSSADVIAELPQVVLYFSFSPDCPVVGERIEAKVHGENLQITWAINQYLEGIYKMRWCQAEIVYDEEEGALIPQGALVEKDGKKGVYIIKKGIITFFEVLVLGEKADYYLVENLESYENVVLNPDKVKEGQRFSW